MSEFRLPARVQPQLWLNNNAVDAGASIDFDAHDAMLALRAPHFSKVAAEILGNRGHDYDDLALNSGVIDKWLEGSREATFYVDVEDYDFAVWLESIGLTEDEAFNMTEELIETVRERMGTAVAAPSAGI